MMNNTIDSTTAPTAEVYCQRGGHYVNADTATWVQEEEDGWVGAEYMACYTCLEWTEEEIAHEHGV